MQETVNIAELLIHEQVSLWANESPHKTAVCYGDEALAYSDLLARANQLARHLRGEGVQAGSLVVICLNRSVEIVVAILGCLLAGGAYVPIDPTYPRERIRVIMENSGAKFVVTESTLIESLPAESGKIVALDTAAPQISQMSTETLENVTDADKPAYVIYTSGSTGVPKGVMVSHGSLRNFVRLSQSALDVSAEDVYLQSASISYAVAVRQIMVSLSRGATLALASSDQMRDPLALFAEIKRKRVTLMDVVPSFWRAINNSLRELSDSARRELLQNDLRRIACVGEALPFDTPRDWARLTSHRARLVNIFGQTETTGFVAAYPIPTQPDDKAEGVTPIGKNIAETNLYIVDERLNPVAPGEIGELCISNPCLASGYLNQTELTEKKFIGNPFKDGRNDRLYRTGDLARQREDGNIVFLGRGDTQVKIRGQRLELGEVESALRKLPEVGDCVVLLAKDRQEDGYLAAYLVPAGSSIDVAAVRQHCRETLPEYMIPSVFTVLDKLPLSPNGKVDRRALSALTATAAPETITNPDLPRDAVEEKLTGIWRDLLPQKNFGVHDDFFDLGGHSLMAVRLFTRIEKEFGVRLPLTTLFHAATIASIAEMLKTPEHRAQSNSIIIPINTLGEKPILFGIHGYEGGVLFWRDIGKHLPVDQPFYAIQAQGVDGTTPALTRIEDMASLYISEVQKIQPHGPYFFCGFSMGGNIAYEMAQQLLLQDESVELLVMLDTRNPERLARFSAYGMMDVKTGAPSDSHPHYVSVWQRIRWQFQHLSSMDFSGKAGHVWLLLRTKFMRAVVFNLATFIHARKLRLPDRLLLTYLRTIHSKALHDYIPQPYAGKLTLFRSSQTERESSDDTQWGWKALARGGAEIYRFIADHNIVAYEYAETVAEKLKECLERAQRSLSASSSRS